MTSPPALPVCFCFYIRGKALCGFVANLTRCRWDLCICCASVVLLRLLVHCFGAWKYLSTSEHVLLVLFSFSFCAVLRWLWAIAHFLGGGGNSVLLYLREDKNNVFRVDDFVPAIADRILEMRWAGMNFCVR